MGVIVTAAELFPTGQLVFLSPVSLAIGLVVSTWRLCPKHLMAIAQPDHPRYVRSSRYSTSLFVR